MEFSEPLPYLIDWPFEFSGLSLSNLKMTRLQSWFVESTATGEHHLPYAAFLLRASCKNVIDLSLFDLFRTPCR
jgi:hypothetical protein